MARGKHVFSEKPMALTVADCRRMQSAAKKVYGMNLAIKKKKKLSEKTLKF